MQVRTERLGPLVCRVVDERSQKDAPPRTVVVLCHGYGAPGDDLVALAGELLHLRSTLRDDVVFVFPEAPNVSEANPWDGRAWWQIDLAALQRAIAKGEARALVETEPEGLKDSRTKLQATLHAVAIRYRATMSNIIVGGFSQGAMLATDVVLRAEEAPKALVVLSGTLMCQNEWRKRAPSRKGLRVLQSHGTQDPVLPFFAATLLETLLKEAGLDVTFDKFDSGHTIWPTTLRTLSAWL